MLDINATEFKLPLSGVRGTLAAVATINGLARHHFLPIVEAPLSSKPWFPWFSTDYRAKTAHLTFVEDSAYRRLLDAYYERRGPLPAARPVLYRMCGAMGPEEAAAIDSVVSQFFTESGGELHHQRCDSEILVEQRLRERGIKGADARWHTKPMPNGCLNDGISQSHPQPQPQSQKPKSTTLLSKLNGNPYLAQAKELLQFLNEKAGRAYRGNVNLEIIIARLNDGASFEDCRSVIAKKCREWKGDEKMTNYLRPATLFNRTKFAQYQGELIGGDDGMS